MTGTLTSQSAKSPASKASAAPAEPTARMVRALFRKTLAETAYVTIGAWAVAGMWIAAQWFSATDGFRRPLQLGGLVMDPWLTGPVAVACAAVGFLLGLLQFWPLRQFDQWALLVHRPWSRAGLLVWSSLAGLGVYGITVVLPLGVFLAWALSDHRVTPVFYWGFFGPYVASVATGVVLYFAGIVLILRQARWYGTRLLPLAAGVLILVVSLALRKLTAVLAVDALALAAFGAAAWGCVASQGRMEKVPVIARVGLLASLTAGCVLAAWIIGVLGDALINRDVLERYPYVSMKRPTYTSAGRAFLTDGRIALMIRTYRSEGNGTSEVLSTQIVDRADRPLPAATSVAVIFSASFWEGDESLEPYSYRTPDSIVSEVILTPPPAQPHLPVGLTLAAGESLEMVRPLDRYQPKEGPVAPHWDVAVTTGHIYFVNRDTHHVEAALPLKYSLRKYSMAAGVDYGRRFLTVSYGNVYFEDSFSAWTSRVSGHPESRNQYETYDMQGTLIDAADSNQLEPLMYKYVRSSDTQAEAREAAYQRLSFSRGMLHSVGMSLNALPLERWTTISPGYDWQNGYWYERAFDGVIVANAAGALMLLGTARWYRLRAAATAAWVAAGLIAGPMLMVVFVAFHWFPVRVACPACGKKRAVGRALCRNCGAAFPKPAARGTEIFAGAETMVSQVAVARAAYCPEPH